MSSVDRKLDLLRRIALLRRAFARSPRDRDIATVRAELEEELGETVSRRIAARFLGVSHTALGRWIESGDVPLVYGLSGRMEVPVPFLLELHEKISQARTAGNCRSHLLELVLTADRERAGTKSYGQSVDVKTTHAAHSRASERGLAYHRAVAKRLNRHMANEARYRVWKWSDAGKLDPRYAAIWESVLDRPLPEIARVMAEDSPTGRDLRQTSPFAGMLSEPERGRLLTPSSETVTK